MRLLRRSTSVRPALVLAGWLLGGCHGAGTGGLPTWYLPNDGAYPRAAYVVGRAACGAEVAPAARPSCAAERAVEDAVLQLRAHVTAVQARECRLDTTERAADGAKHSAAESRCSSEVGGRSESSLELSNTTPREQACDRTTCYALVALSRAELAERVAESHAGERASFEDLLSRALSADLLSSLALLAQAAALAPPLDDAASLSRVFAPRGAPNASFAQRVLATRQARLRGTTFCLRSAQDSEPSPERVFAQATVLLSEQGVDQVQLGARCASGALTIDYQPTAAAPVARRSQDQDALWTISYAGLLRVSSPDGALAREQEVLGHGLSRTADAARRDAEDRLAGAVREAIATLVLGLSV